MHNIERENEIILFIFRVCDMIGDVSCKLERCDNHISIELEYMLRHCKIMITRDEFASITENEFESGKENLRIVILNKLLKK